MIWYCLQIALYRNIRCITRGGTKKHRGFTNDSYTLLETMMKKHCTIHIDALHDFGSLNNVFVAIHEYNASQQAKIQNQNQDNKDDNKDDNNIEDKKDDTHQKSDTLFYDVMWEHIFEGLGVLPRDCSCKAYSRTLYERCIVLGKPRKGLRPKHDTWCNKKVTCVSV